MRRKRPALSWSLNSQKVFPCRSVPEEEVLGKVSGEL